MNRQRPLRFDPYRGLPADRLPPKRVRLEKLLNRTDPPEFIDDRVRQIRENWAGYNSEYDFVSEYVKL